jgi:hypothetical protein
MISKKLLMAICFAAQVFLVSAQNIIYVNLESWGINDGSSWENAYSDLTEAIEASQPGDQIWVAMGVYYPTAQPNYPVGAPDQEFNHFTMKNGVSIYGGFEGDETDLSQRDYENNYTVLSGDIDQNDDVEPEGFVTDYTKINGRNSLKLFYFPEGSTIDTTAVLDGFILTGAYADNDVFPYMGGAAMLCEDASPKVLNCEFTGNYAKAAGGAIWLRRSSMIIENCVFSGNKALTHAGAFYYTESEVRLKGCTFVNNEGNYGGAIASDANESVSVFEDCHFESNKALNNAGVLTTSKSPNVFKNCTFKNNTAPWGGALVLYTESSSEVINCVFEGNHAAGSGTSAGDGGAINAAYDSKVTIYNSYFRGNKAFRNGGAINVNYGSDLTAYNTLFTGNVNGSIMEILPTSTNSGSAVYSRLSKVTLINNTVTGNYSFDYTNGAAVNNWDAEVNVKNSIIWNNRGSNQIRLTGSSVGEVSNSIVQGGFTGAGNLNVDPLFLEPINPSKNPSTAGNFKLWGHSPGNNKGNNSFLSTDLNDLDDDGNTTEILPVDLNGNPRIFAGVVDMGCYEQQFMSNSGNALVVADGQRLQIDNSPTLTNTDFTIEFWINPSNNPVNDSYHNVCGSPDGTSTARRSPTIYLFQYDRIHYGFGNGSSWVAGDTRKAVKQGQWNHIAMTFNNANEIITIYANGKKVDEVTNTGKPYNTPIGFINSDGELRANIDEFRVWTEERTLQEIIDNMNSKLSGNEQNLKLYYSFDQVQGGLIEDQAGIYSATLLNGAGLINSEALQTPLIVDVTDVGTDNFTISWFPVPNAFDYYIDIATDPGFQNIVKSGLPANGNTQFTVDGLSRGTIYYYKVTAKTNNDEWGHSSGYIATRMTPPGNAFAFDGSTYIDATNVCKYSFTEGTTIETWIKVDPASVNSKWSPWAINPNDGLNNYTLLYENTANGYQFFLSQFDYDANSYTDNYFSETTIQGDTWYHIALTIDNNAGTGTFYLNGVSKGNFNILAEPYPYRSFFSIGQEFDKNSSGDLVASDFFTGEMDEFRIWQRPLTQQEIQDRMYKTCTGKEDDLVTYYSFDIQSGDLVLDHASLFDGYVVGNANWVESTNANHDFKVISSLETHDGFTLTWDAVTGANNYLIELATDASFENIVTTSALQSETEYAATSLSPGMRYYFRVTTDNAVTSIVNYTVTLMETPGNALVFDGVSDWVEVNQVAALDFGKTATIETWAWVDPTETRGMIWAINSETGGNRYLLTYQNGIGYHLYRGDGGVTIPSNQDQKGTWVHLAVTIDGSNGAVFYMNGERIGSIDGATTYPFINGDQFSLAQEFDGLRATDFFKGKIDEVRVWNTIRTEQQILDNMHSKIDPDDHPDMMAYYDFDQGTGKFVAERVKGLNGSIKSNPQWGISEAIISPIVYAVEDINPNGALLKWRPIAIATDYKLEVATDQNFQQIVKTVATTNGSTEYELTSLQPGTDHYIRVASLSNRWSGWSKTEEITTLLMPPGNAFYFDGTSNYISMDGVTNEDYTNGATIELWVKPELKSADLSNSDRSVIWANNTPTGFNHYVLVYNSVDKKMALWGTSVVFDIDMNDIWNHVAVILRKNQPSYIYVNGRQMATFTDAKDPLLSNSGFSIGQEWDGEDPSDFYAGAIDELRIWNKALDEAEMLTYAHTPVNAGETGLIAYFNFDEKEGSFVYDKSNTYSGEVIGTVERIESKALITPFSLQADAITDDGFTANWSTIPDAQNYFLRIATDPKLTQLVHGFDNIDAGNATNYIVTGLNPNTQYYFGAMSETEQLSAWSAGSEKVVTTGPDSGELAIDLTGDNNYIDLSAHAARIAGKSAGAITGWFKGNENGIFYQMTGSNPASDYMNLGVGDISGGLADESLWFWIAKGGTVKLSMGTREGHNKYLDNNWHHFAVITGDGNNRMIIDGVEKETFILDNYGSTQSQEFSNINSPAAVNIGKNISIMVDEIAIFSNPITNQEAIERAHLKLQGDEMGLVMYYDFNNRNDTLVADASGKGRDASVEGAVGYAAANLLITPFLDEPTTGVTLADLSWDAIPDASQYYVDVATDYEFINKLTDNLNIATNSFNVDHLDKNSKYFYRVKAVADSVQSEWSGTRDFRTIPGKSMVFDAALKQYIRVDGISNYSSDQATIECWVKPEYTDGHQAIWAHNDALTNVNQYVLMYTPSNNDLMIYTMSQGGGFDDYLIGQFDLIGQWNHIAVSITKDAPSYVYLNGKKVFEFTHHLQPIVNGYEFSIGQEWDGNFSESNFFSGEMDEFRVWNIALSEEQIRANMNISKPEWASDHFIAHYTFDDVFSGNTIKDHANYNHGRLFGGATQTAPDGSIENPNDNAGLPYLADSDGVINPITLEPTDVTSGSFVLNVNNIPSAESIEVVVAYDPTFVPPLAVHKNIGKSLHYLLDELCPGVKYYYRARAIYDENTLSDWSVTDTVTTVNEDALVTNFVATQGDYSGNLKLSWGCENDYLVTDFVISRRIEGESEFEQLVTIPNDGSLMQYTDNSAMPGTYYEYAIQGMSYCYQNDTEIVYSNIGFNIPALATSKEINPETNETYIRVEWDYHSNFCNNVEIVRTDTESGIDQVFQEVADSLVYRDIDAGLCIPYRYQLVAKTARFGDVNSKNSVFTLEQDITAAMDTLDASKAYYDNRIILNWVSTSQNVIDEYQISRRRYASGNAWQVVKVIDRGTTQTWIDEDATAGIYYEYAIVGFATCGNNLLMTDSVFSVGIRQPEGALSGQVNYQGGNPVSGVKITANYNDPALTLGRCLEFDANDSIVMESSIPVDFANGFTMEFWINPSNVNQAATLFANSSIFAELDGAGNIAVQMGSANASYNLTSDIGNVWDTNSWNHVAMTAANGEVALIINGERAASGNGALLLSLDQRNIIAQNFEGYLDEFRIWNTQLTDSLVSRRHNLMLGRELPYQVCALRFDEGLGIYAFDHTRKQGEPNKNHATIYGADWSQSVPTIAKLAPGAITEPYGSYQVDGLRFSGSGNTYRITPSLGVHAFDPSGRSMLISENSLVHGDQDFTDISSFLVTGNVKYLGANFPVDGVMLAVDGQIAVDAEGSPIVTDEFGDFSIEVPIGDHFISVAKMGHIFSEGFFPPKDDDGEVTYFNFNDNLSGIQFIDSTFLTVAGRIVGGTVEGDKPIGFGYSENNLGVSSFTVKASKGFPISETTPAPGNDPDPIFEITVNTDPVTGEYEIKLFPEQFEFVGQIGNNSYNFNSIEDLALIDLSGTIQSNTETDTLDTGEVLSYEYHLKRNWIHRSVPKIEVLAEDGTPHFYDHTLTAEDENQNPVEIDLITQAGDHVMGYPVFSKGGYYKAIINVFEEYENADNGALDRVPVNDGVLTTINGCAAYPAPVEHAIENGVVEYEFLGGFPNPAYDINNPDESYTKTFGVYAQTGENGSMHSQWPENGQFKAYVLGGIPTGNNFVTQGPDLVDFILRDPVGSASSAYFESGFTVSNTVSNSFSNSSATSMGLEVDLGWEVTTFVGLGAGIISTQEQVANVETGVTFTSDWENEHSFSTSTTYNKSYSTSDDPLYTGEQGDLFFGHSTNISYGVSNYVKVVPVGDGDPDSEIDVNVNGFTIGKKKGINFGLQYNTDFIFSLNHIENYLIPDLEAMYEYHMGNGSLDSANHFMQQADIWRSVLAENEYQKYTAINTPDPDDKNISFDAGAIYEESITTEITETTSSSYSFSIDSSVESELGFEVMGMGTTWSFSQESGSSESSSSEDSETTSTTVGFTLADPDQGDYYSVDVLKCLHGNGPIFVSKGGQSSCPYEGGNQVEYADYLDRDSSDPGFYNGYDLAYPTMRIEVPAITAENAILSNIPDNQPAEFKLKLSNLSEVNADVWYTLTMDVASNPHGAIVKMDGASISNGIAVLVPGGTMLTKTLQVFKGQSGINSYENINIILHSQCQFDPTDDLEDIADTVRISAHFVPTCTPVDITNPGNNWLVNSSGNDALPVNIANYNIQHGTFEKIAFQYRSQSTSNWNTAMMFFKNADDMAEYEGNAALIDGDQVFYNWDVAALQDRNYVIRAAAMCVDESVAFSDPLEGTIDRKRPEVFGTPQPSDGILSPGEDIMITFSEPIEEGLVTPYNILLEGVINGTGLHHGTSVALDGTAAYIATPDGINLTDRSFAFELWLQKPETAEGTLVSFGNPEAGSFTWNFAGTDVVITVDDQIFTVEYPFADANWHHWSVSYDHDFNLLTIYADDQLILENNAEAVTAQGPIYIGKRHFNDDNHLAANIHDFRVWRKPLTFSDVIENMSIELTGNEPALAGYWPMNEGTGTLLLDKARSRHATMFAEWSLQPSGNAYAFNGTDQALIMETGSIPISRLNDFTVEMWFKTTTPAANSYLFANGNTETMNEAAKTLAIYINPQGNVVVESNGKSVVSPATYTDDAWHHLSFVVNRRGYATLYLDAAQVASIIAPEVGSVENAFAYIGARGYADNSLQQQLDGFFAGSLDEVRIWNVARRHQQVELYKNHRIDGTETGLLAYFPFEAYEEVMSVLQSIPTLVDQSVDPDSSTGENHVGELQAAGADGFTANTPAIKRKRSKSSVNYDFVINNDKIIITPTDPLAALERCILEITVKNIEDKNANRLASPATWTAFMEQNVVRWQDTEFDLDKEIDQPISFTNTIVNLGGTEQTFTIANMPAWLTAQPTNGTLTPNSSVEVTFTISEGLNIGRYNEEVYLQSESGYNEKMMLNVNVFKQAPDWHVDENLYSNSMNVIGKVRIRGVFSNDENDMIAAFVGNECRGVANLEYKVNYDDHFVFFVVYGGNDTEQLTYKVWDASEGKVYSDVSPALTYQPNELHGTIAEPVIFDVTGLMDNTISFNTGWNWISFNLDMNNPSVQNIFSNMVVSDSDLIAHAEFYSTYHEATNTWLGTLNEVEIGKLYRVHSAQGGELTYLGAEINMADHPVALVNGWNRIGYVPNFNLTVNEALSGFEPQLNDVIKSQHQFAMWDGYEWIGSLRTMRAGRGYMYRSFAADEVSFIYPAASQKNDNSPDEAQLPAGNLTNHYEFSMNVVARVIGIQPQAGDQVAAYINGTLRASVPFSSNSAYADFVFATIAGEAEDHNQTVSFSLIRNGQMIPLTGTVDFKTNGIEGDSKAPLLLTADATTNTSWLSGSDLNVTIYPNPFTNVADIVWEAFDGEMAEITITNAQGAVVARFDAQPASNGTQTIRWNGDNLQGGKVTPGIYHVKVKTNAYTRVLQVIKSE